jgi:Txe/YoeB family toxin of toxin-antitoxin system
MNSTKFNIVYTKQAIKDLKILKKHPSLLKTFMELKEVMKINPYQNPPEYEKLQGAIKGLYSRRINIHNRLVYQVNKKEKIIKIIRTWTHYE